MHEDARNNIVNLAIQNSWKAWGKLRKYGGSSYQCFRRKNDYLWIGLRFIERWSKTDNYPVVDFVLDSDDDIKRVIL